MRLAGVSDRLGNLESFFAEGNALGERALLGMAFDKVGTGKHGRAG